MLPVDKFSTGPPAVVAWKSRKGDREAIATYLKVAIRVASLDSEKSSGAS